MKTNGNWGVVARIARRSQALAALLAAALIFASVGRAQSSAAPAPAPGAKPAAAAPAKSTPPPAAKPPSKASQEGINVHGHWIIEVKNPDGKIANRVEFENALCTTQALSAGAGGGFLFWNVGGDQLLAQLTSGSGGPYYEVWTVQLSPAPPTGQTPCV